jgi:RNA polymerase sigma-70 factor (ECF subfamily)
MDEHSGTSERFEEHRGHLRAVAYRMLGSLDEADDAVQEAWLRFHRAGEEGVENLGGWLTTVVARICLDRLRSRKAQREEPLGFDVPDPIVAREDGGDPEHQALLTDEVGLALLVVLERLAPAERLAFVLHDLFAVPFEEIAPIVERTPAAARQLASRARRRVQGAATAPDAPPRRQREVVDAFLAASREGDFEGLVAVLDPDAVLHADAGPARLVEGAEAIAGQAMRFRDTSRLRRHALVDGVPSVVSYREAQPVSILTFTVEDGRVARIDVIADPERLARLPL